MRIQRLAFPGFFSPRLVCLANTRGLQFLLRLLLRLSSGLPLFFFLLVMVVFLLLVLVLMLLPSRLLLLILLFLVSCLLLPLVLSLLR